MGSEVRSSNFLSKITVAGDGVCVHAAALFVHMSHGACQHLHFSSLANVNQRTTCKLESSDACNINTHYGLISWRLPASSSRASFASFPRSTLSPAGPLT